MIVFHNDQLVCPELCRLLSQSVPEELHIPMVFYRRGNTRRYPMGRCNDDYIEIFLNGILGGGLIESRLQSPSVAVWFQLLKTCYHEFGHVVMPPDFPYEKDYKRRWEYEKVVSEWGEQMLWKVASRTPNLCQPNWMGYLSIRLKKLEDDHLDNHRDYTHFSHWILERRFAKFGGQLSLTNISDILRAPRKLVKEIAERQGIGLPILDKAGRRHLMFFFGDVFRLYKSQKESSSGDLG